MEEAVEKVVERLSIRQSEGTGTREISHLAVRLDVPKQSRPAAPVLLYLHGFASRQAGEKATFFRRRALGSGLAFCSFDFRGHGESGGDMLELTLSRNLEDVGRVCDFLAERGFGKPILFGSSMGGGAALWYSALHPERVAGGVHIAPALEMAEGLLRRVGPEAEARWRHDGVYALEHELGAQRVGWGLIEDLRSYELERLEALLRTPTLIFQGKNDKTVSARACVDFVLGCRFEAIELHVFADGDHRLIEHLEHLWRLALSFLEARSLVQL